MINTSDLFDIDLVDENLRSLLQVEFPWQVLTELDKFTAEIQDLRLGRVHPTAVVEGKVFIAKSASIGPHVYIQGPAWIAENAKVKHGACLRSGVVLAAGAEVGARTEVKRSLFLNSAKAAHLNYVGDSILGYKVNLGAGVKLANFKTFGTNINVANHETGLRKLGAMLGDHVSIGCNAVTVPGTIIGKRSIIYNLAMARGVVAADSILKLRQQFELSERRG